MSLGDISASRNTTLYFAFEEAREYFYLYGGFTYEFGSDRSIIITEPPSAARQREEATLREQAEREAIARAEAALREQAEREAIARATANTNHGVPNHSVPKHGTPSHAVPSHSAPNHSAPNHGVPNHAVPFQVGDSIILNGHVYVDSYGNGRGRYFSNHRDVISIITSGHGRAHPYHIDGIGWVHPTSLTRV